MNKIAPIILVLLLALAAMQIWSSRGTGIRAGEGSVSEADLVEETTTVPPARTFAPLSPLPGSDADATTGRRSAPAGVATTRSPGTRATPAPPAPTTATTIATAGTPGLTTTTRTGASTTVSTVPPTAPPTTPPIGSSTTAATNPPTTPAPTTAPPTTAAPTPPGAGNAGAAGST